MTVMPLDRSLPNPDQPGKEFPQRKLEELAQSIRECGLLEPIVVSPRSGRLRRCRASPSIPYPPRVKILCLSICLYDRILTPNRGQPRPFSPIPV
jgi:hypothetical protein